MAHNLAEATIVAGRLGQTIPDAALNQGLSGTGLRATTRLVRGPLPGGQQRRAATTELQPGGLRYQIEVVTRRGPGGRIDTLVWHERQLD